MGITHVPKHVFMWHLQILLLGNNCTTFLLLPFYAQGVKYICILPAALQIAQKQNGFLKLDCYKLWGLLFFLIAKCTSFFTVYTASFALRCRTESETAGKNNFALRNFSVKVFIPKKPLNSWLLPIRSPLYNLPCHIINPTSMHTSFIFGHWQLENLEKHGFKSHWLFMGRDCLDWRWILHIRNK